MHKLLINKLLVSLLLTAMAGGSVMLAPLAFAQDPSSPIGLWKNIDDHTGKPKALIRVSEANGIFSGKIEKLLRDPSEDQNPKCVKCEGELKEQPILGMTIITGMQKDGSEYNGGKILDPNNGKIYKSKMSLSDNGQKLAVRGYIGVPMLGRTQIWWRQE